MTIAKRLMVACAGVMVAGLGFFTPKAQAGLTIDLRIEDGSPTGTNHLVVTPAQAMGQRYIVDVVATVTGHQWTATVPTKVYNPDLDMFLFPTYPAESLDVAVGAVTLTNAQGVLAGTGTGLSRGNGAGGPTITTNYQDTGFSASPDRISTGANGAGVYDRLGSTSVSSADSGKWIFASGIADPLVKTDGLIISPLGDPTQQSTSFVIAQVNVFMGTTAPNGGQVQLNWVTAPSTVVNSPANWYEDAITGILPAPDSKGNPYIVSPQLSPSTGSFAVGSGAILEVLVPEPATLGLFAVGALVCGLRRNRRK